MKPIKLHLGCGDVYLKGYMNIDSDSLYSTLLSDLPTLKRSNFLNNMATTLDKYYSKRIGDTKGEVICDQVYDISKLHYYKKNSVQEIVAFHVLEHFDMKRSEEVLENWVSLLKLGSGTLRICVPDIREICKRILSPDDEEFFDKRHSYKLLFGSHNSGALLDGHKSAWDLDKLKIMFKYLGMSVGVLPSPTDWKFNPSLSVIGVKNESQK